VSHVGPRDATAFEVRDALREPGCAVCRLTLRSVQRLLRSIAYEQVNDLDLRETLRGNGGFCTPHSYQWLHEAHSVLGTALIYRDVLLTALRDLEGGVARKRFGRSRQTRCPACEAQHEAEGRYLDVLAALIRADPAVSSEVALCRRHALAALRAGAPLREPTVGMLRALIADLDEVIRKEDYRFRQEPRSDAERSAPARAIAWAAGLEGLVDT
jgi:hypothetical protein